ncbi:MAG TPA: carbamate kinase [Parachlamydiales bacterium]|nr:MAG: carbamate kinase [Chlamydiae bacterium GWF2_49_8]OGN58099.1 MAG: carbamate kinase [Chlamydiae bacterium RIFCSPHIGHO2_02_FULL_49_29]OGN63731.1 MAG: carbamate kinase [Chlamydiae bacterium RIFCSPHIGHO2_12_FULL_49_32]OGN70743.1 MAG: carbamate kinase [Chlamydiae bacterium RIFCSPLOWO2_12_FULL_49_12]OGN71148.1 MAG: carbamate kinase [Chlamydiae bacterium RIFCSPLOWO2_02_FULL_49_12]HAZ16161.1 carbamate kinase [Parachlamydiales bacterium]
MKILLALGGNALIQRGQSLAQETQLNNIKHAAEVIASLTKTNQVILCHGNGPQVGLISLMSHAYKEVPSYTLDVLVAESQGMIGYLLQNALYNAGVKNAVTLLTQVIVDKEDPAFKTPTKPIGPVYDKETAFQLAKEKGWDVAPDGKFYRRVVPSPAPKEIVEWKAAHTLVEAGNVVILCGGGGVPVTRNGKRLEGSEAVIDKDRASALAALYLKVDHLLILTDVDGVYENWGTDKERVIKTISPATLTSMEFAKGSMWPKVQAACDFVEKTQKTAVIGNLFQGEALLKGTSGTLITKEAKKPSYY